MLGKKRDRGSTQALPRAIHHLLTRMAAPPARARKQPAIRTPEMRAPLKNEAAKTVEFVMAHPERICQKMGIAALELRKRVYQYTAKLYQYNCFACSDAVEWLETHRHQIESKEASRVCQK